MSRKNGFTLIELLVVIAIIAILAAILFPVFSKARDIAKRSGCVNNMKQIGFAVKMYMDDNNDTLPLPVVVSGNDQSYNYYWPQATWRTAIDKYVRSEKVFSCPARTIAENARDTENTRYRLGHYGINPWYVTHPTARNIPQKALFIGEVVNYWIMKNSGVIAGGDIAMGGSSQEFLYTSVIHNGWVSYLALDGSAHSVKVERKKGLDGSPLFYSASFK